MIPAIWGEGVKSSMRPRKLIKKIPGVTFVEMDRCEETAIVAAWGGVGCGWRYPKDWFPLRP